LSTLKKAKLKLVLNHPFFASIALRMKYVEDESVGTMSIGKDTIKYSPDFVNKLSTDQCVGLLAHEVLHYTLCHHTRMGDREFKDWNKACDYAVNSILLKSKFYLPEGYLYNPDFAEKAAEDIYKAIHQEPEKGDQGDQSENESGDDQGDQSDQSNQGDGKNDSGDENSPENWGKVESVSQEETQQAEAEAKQAAVEAINVAKQAGSMPGGLEEIISELIEPKKNWQELLQKFAAELAKNDYSWSKPNNRYLPSGLYLPKLESLEIGKFAFVIDTSGSVNKPALIIFFSELKEIALTFNFSVTVLYCHTNVWKVEEFTDDYEIPPLERGGTSFKPAFDYVNDEMPDTKALVYFTDGECYEKLQEPEYETLWVIYDNKRFKPQFGQVIYI
jgi:predicted metal-dependent peptidase